MSGPATIGASCPGGGKFFVCQNSRIWFLGCCMSDPCTSEREGVCPQADLRTTSFSKTSYDLIKPQQCVDPDSETKWYTCSGTIPPFMGCCKTDPCKNPDICPASKLSAARLSDKLDYRQVFLTSQTQSSAPSSTRTTATSSPTQTLTDANPSTTPPSTTPSNTPLDEVNKSGGLSTGAIVGIAVGGAVVFLALIVFCIIRFRRNTTWSNKASNKAVQMMGFVGASRTAEHISASTFSPNSGQPSFGVGSPHFAEPFGSPPFAPQSVNMGAGYGGPQYSELPVEDQYHRRELQG
ncbi:hypothetical protein QBC43DRAFT_361455 [Cladorrhinum sp. PSN259]|nr:hypothetical protein QBC43DRAFT_361455 [Cladorrhinum sp. PSN259]